MQQSASLNELSELTDEGEVGGEDEEHAVAVHGECDGEVGGQASPNKKLVHCRPVKCVETKLKKRKHYLYFIMNKMYISS